MRLSATVKWLQTRLEVLVTPDWRSLLGFRLLLGFGLLVDLMQRLQEFSYLYTEAGIFPRAMWEKYYGGSSYYWSWHHLLDAAWWPHLLVIVQLTLTLIFVAGFAGRLACLLNALLMLSLVLYNPLVHYGGDKLLPLLLFIAAFLPLTNAGLAALRKGRLSLVTRLAYLWLTLQVVVLYTGSGVAKIDGSYWLQGSAMANVFDMNMLVRPLAVWLRHFDFLLVPASFAVPWAELLLPVLLLLPFWRGGLRLSGIVLLLLLNAGIQSTLDVGYFMSYASAALIALLPTRFWELLRLVPEQEAALSARKQALSAPKQKQAPWWSRLGMLLAVPFILVAMLSTYLTWAEDIGLFDVDFSTREWHLIRTFNSYQNWGVFTGPNPTASWYVAEAALHNGALVDIFQGGDVVSWNHRKLPNTFFKSDSKWRVAMAKINDLDDNVVVRERFAEVVARWWNDHHPKKEWVRKLSIYKFSQPLPIVEDNGRRFNNWAVIELSPSQLLGKPLQPVIPAK